MQPLRALSVQHWEEQLLRHRALLREAPVALPAPLGRLLAVLLLALTALLLLTGLLEHRHPAGESAIHLAALLRLLLVLVESVA